MISAHVSDTVAPRPPAPQGAQRTFRETGRLTVRAHCTSLQPVSTSLRGYRRPRAVPMAPFPLLTSTVPCGLRNRQEASICNSWRSKAASRGWPGTDTNDCGAMCSGTDRPLSGRWSPLVSSHGCLRGGCLSRGDCGDRGRGHHREGRGGDGPEGHFGGAGEAGPGDGHLGATCGWSRSW